MEIGSSQQVCQRVPSRDDTEAPEQDPGDMCDATQDVLRGRGELVRDDGTRRSSVRLVRGGFAGVYAPEHRTRRKLRAEADVRLIRQIDSPPGDDAVAEVLGVRERQAREVVL